MFGSFQVNGKRVEREISFAQALPGFLIVTDAKKASLVKNGDLIQKMDNGVLHTRVHPNPCVFQDNGANPFTVTYVDINIDFKQVETSKV